MIAFICFIIYLLSFPVILPMRRFFFGILFLYRSPDISGFHSLHAIRTRSFQLAGSGGKKLFISKVRINDLTTSGIQQESSILSEKYALSLPQFSSFVKIGFTEIEWRDLLSIGESRELLAGSLLFEEGCVREDQSKRGVYLILDGMCHLEVKGQRVAALGPGTFGGEASFVANRQGPRTASIRVTSEKLLAVRWDTSALQSLLDDPKQVQLKTFLYAYWTQELANKLTSAMRRLEAPQGSTTQNSINVARSYGFRRNSGTTAIDEDITVVPPSAFELAKKSFGVEYAALRRLFRFGEVDSAGNREPDSTGKLIPRAFAAVDNLLENTIFPTIGPMSKARIAAAKEAESYDGAEALASRRAALKKLKLSNKRVSEREDARIARTRELIKENARVGVIMAIDIERRNTPWIIMGGYKLLCWILDTVFEDRPIQRFWFLETVARMPYFSYLSILHLYETLGWWTVGTEVRRVHFSEEWNEMNHLKIMEALGGDTRWSDRFIARHAAILYYWALCLLYIFSPFLSYNFSELIESHAVDTYGEFVDENEELLKSLPPPPEAVAYYCEGDMYMFDEFQTGSPAYSRRPLINNLYDVFSNIRDDESEHVKTMFACERENQNIRSPNEVAASQLYFANDDDEQKS